MSNTVIRLKPEYIAQILASPELQGKVAAVSNKSVNTVYRWCRANAPQLTMLCVLQTIRQHVGVPAHVPLTAHIPAAAATG